MGHPLSPTVAIIGGFILIIYGLVAKNQFYYSNIGRRGQPYKPEWYDRILPISLGLLFFLGGLYLLR
jgi:hypothetical protein